MQTQHVKDAIQLFGKITEGFAKEGVTPRHTEESPKSTVHIAARISRNDAHDFEWSILHTDETSVVTVKLNHPGVHLIKFSYDLFRGTSTLFQQKEGEASSPLKEGEMLSDTEMTAFIVAMAWCHQRVEEALAEMGAAAV